MLLAKCYCALLGRVVGDEEIDDAAWIKALGLDDTEILCAALGVMTINVGGLVFEMEEEPQLKARVGEGDIDVALTRFVQCLGEVRVLIDVKYTPDLVVVGVVGSPTRLPPSLLMLAGTLDEGERSEAGFCEVDMNSTIATCPLR